MMRSALFGFILASYVASTSPECWSPLAPAVSSCSVCSPTQVKGAQCSRSGKTFPCYESADACCKDGDVLSHVTRDVCLASSKKTGVDITPFDDDDDSDSDSEDDEDEIIEEEECKRVVARSSATSNRHCMSECSRLVKEGVSPGSDKSWSQLCMTSHWHEENGRAVPEGSCFQKWVYGYSDPVNRASVKTSLTAETPALCQALCQEDNDCINWLWITPLYTPGTEAAHRCLLKSKSMVEKSLSIITETQPPTNLDANYCHGQMGYSCQNGFNCLPCDGQRRCVWESHLHISGWKYCDHSDSCSADALSSVRAMTQAPAPTTLTIWERIQDGRTASKASQATQVNKARLPAKVNEIRKSEMTKSNVKK